jgi:hypothetical protein
MNTYKSYKQLVGKTLTKGDKVVFSFPKFAYEYIVDDCFLRIVKSRDGEYRNCIVFDHLGVKRAELEAIAALVYDVRKEDIRGDWPQFNNFEAATNLVLVLFQFLEGKSHAEAPGTNFLVNKLGEKASWSKDLTVPKEFVLEAHKVACSEWKNKIETQFPELFDDLKTYDIGTRVEISEAPHVLTMIRGELYLVSLLDGLVWSHEGMTPVMTDGGELNMKVTRRQLERYVDGNFTIVNK